MLTAAAAPIPPHAAQAAVAHDQPDPLTKKQVLLLTVNRLGYDDIRQMPHLQQLATRGATALMNVNTGGRRTDGNAYATMALGVPARVEEASLLAFNAQETRHDVPVSLSYARGQGGRVDQGVVVLSMPRLQQEHSRREFQSALGGIGDALQKKGLQAAVFGSGDRGETLWRPATLLTTDSKGRTPHGDVGGTMLQKAPDRPYGVKTDYARLWQHYLRVRSQASLIVFDLADLSRLAAYRPHMTEEHHTRTRAEVLREIDAFLGKLAQEAGPDRLLLVTSPQVSEQAAATREWLSPVVAAGGNMAEGTALTSATTRRVGIVSNLDVAPTVLRFLGATPPGGMIGYPLQPGQKMSLQKLDQLKQRTVWTYTHRGLVLGLVGALAGLGILLALLRLVVAIRFPATLVRILIWLGLAMPLCLYLLPILRVEGIWEALGGLLAMYLLFVSIPFRIMPFCQSLLGRLTWVAGWTTAVVVWDTWQGGFLAKNSLLSYDPIVGARYYGVGNEYMGVVIGAVVLLFGAVLTKWQTQAQRQKLVWLFTLVGLFFTLFFASPALGTNTGGALTMAATTAVCAALIQGYRRWWHLFATVGASLAAAVGLILFFNQLTVAPTHIGAAANSVLTGGAEELLRIFTRKSDMFTRLLFSSALPMLLLAGVLVFGFFVRKQKTLASERGERYTPLWTALAGLLGGAVVGLFTNDSGIVVVAMMFLFALLPALLMWLEEEQRQLREVMEGILE